jgi:hypothetical protein
MSTFSIFVHESLTFPLNLLAEMHFNYNSYLKGAIAYSETQLSLSASGSRSAGLLQQSREKVGFYVPNRVNRSYSSNFKSKLPWWVGVVGKVTAGYADGTGSIPALGRVWHRRLRVLSGLQYS